jgi:hypothetical protein
LKIKIKILWLFFSLLLKIYLRKLSIKQNKENGISMINRKVNGFNKTSNRLKKYKKWNNFFLINWKMNYFFKIKIIINARKPYLSKKNNPKFRLHNSKWSKDKKIKRKQKDKLKKRNKNGIMLR